MLQVGYYMYAKVQVLALKGDHQNALKALEDAENYSGSHEEFAFALVTGWQEIVAATRGLVFEKKGSRADAKKTYQHPHSDYARARLALMALEDGDENEARRLALQDITNPTAGFVLGQLEEKKKNIAAAKEWYGKAWARLQKSTILGGDNEFLPIYFCEGKAITQALERLKE